MLSSFSTSPPPTTHTPRTRKSTNKYTQKNNRYRDRLLALEGHKLAIARARSANNTYISRAKTALLLRKKAELENLSEANQSLAHKEITRVSRQHSILSMLHLGIHWTQKARTVAPTGPWPSLNTVLLREGITRRQYNAFDPESKLGASQDWDVDISRFKDMEFKTLQ
ncbi:hypothetical protein NX059_012509 [Plenodomus lindquistii]|nr:hypothetical protein NX059_012509 [Plenodomus lindquistii]